MVIVLSKFKTPDIFCALIQQNRFIDPTGLYWIFLRVPEARDKCYYKFSGLLTVLLTLPMRTVGIATVCSCTLEESLMGSR